MVLERHDGEPFIISQLYQGYMAAGERAARGNIQMKSLNYHELFAIVSGFTSIRGWSYEPKY